MLEKNSLPALNGGPELPTYEEASRAMAALHDFSPLREFGEKSAALEQYAKVVKDPVLLERAVRIKLEAWRNIGRVLKEMREAGELVGSGGGNPPGGGRVKSLRELGISYNKSAAAGQLWSLPEAEFQARSRLIVDRALRLIGQILKFETERIARKLDSEKAQILYVDPPWQYSNSGLGGAAAKHYPTMTTEEICDYPKRELKKEIGEIVSRDSALFLWATNPLLPDAQEVITAWGFSYKTNYVWVKDKGTFGKLCFYNRGRHELLLLATRGSFVPKIKTLPDSVVSAAKGKHSAKPVIFAEIIEKLYPQFEKKGRWPFRELFCRGEPRRGWLPPLGNEVT